MPDDATLQADRKDLTTGSVGADTYRHMVREHMVRGIDEYAIFTLDTGGTITSWNQGVKAILGYRESAFIGLPAALLFTSENREARAPEGKRAEAARSGKAMNDRRPLRTDGNRFWCNGVMTALHRGGGRRTSWPRPCVTLTARLARGSA